MVGIVGRCDERGRWLPRWLRAPDRRAVECRYELERALHDGPVERLSALAIELDLLSAAAGDLRVVARLDGLRESVCALLEHHRRLGATIHPPVLADGLEPTWMSVAERYDLWLRLDLPKHALGAHACARTGLLVADHLRKLEPGTIVRVRVRGRRFVRVHMTEQRPDSRQRRNFRAVLCG